MSDFRADLHCHTTLSDGSLTPEEVVQLAKKTGLQGLAITDHDNIGAYPAILAVAEEAGLQMITGVEFSCSHGGKSVHVLGYSFPPESPALHALSERHAKRRQMRNQKLMTLLNLTPEEVLAANPEQNNPDFLGRPHIAKALVVRGTVPSVEEAFNQLIGDGRPCYVQGEPISVTETLEILHQAGALAVLAHPHIIRTPALVDELLTLPFDGIECYYSRLPSYREAPWLKKAKKRGMLITGGSDFHGAVKPTIALGSSWVDAERFAPLWDHFQQQRGR